MTVRSTAHNEIEDTFTQSFAMQFISLMLFILIFTVASFLPQLQKQEETAAAKQAVEESKERQKLTPITRPIETVVLEQTLDASFFLEDGQRLNPEKWEAILSLLFRHDLSLKLILPSNEGVEKSVARSSELLDELIRAGAPAAAISIEFNRNTGIETATARIVEGELSW